MPPRTPEQMDADFQRRQQGQQMQMRQQAAPAAQAQMPAKPITNNYMGPPEAPVQAEEPARAGPTGFVGFGQQLAANQDVAQRMALQAGQASAGVGTGALKTDAGRQALLQRAYGKAAQVTELDAALAGGAGGDYFQRLEAEYGPAAQARMAESRRQGAARSAEMQAQMGREGQRLQRERQASERAAEEKRIRDEVARLESQSNSMNSGRRGEVRSITPEELAYSKGMTLEEWVRAGKPGY